MNWEPCECKKYYDLLRKNDGIIETHHQAALAAKAAKNIEKAKKHLQQIRTLKNTAWQLAVKGCAAERHAAARGVGAGGGATAGRNFGGGRRRSRRRRTRRKRRRGRRTRRRRRKTQRRRRRR